MGVELECKKCGLLMDGARIEEMKRHTQVCKGRLMGNIVPRGRLRKPNKPKKGDKLWETE